MSIAKQPKITIVNKFYPPYPGITGEFVHELAEHLITEYNFEVNIVHTDSSYGKSITEMKTLGNSYIVKSVAFGKGTSNTTLNRLITAVIEGYKLIRKAKKINTGEPIIVLTDPAFLIFFAGLLLRRKNWVYWSMDLYPEAYVSSKIMSADNFIYKRFEKFIYNHAPKHIIALGKNQAAYLLSKYQKNIQTTVLPAILEQPHKKYSGTPTWYNPDKVHICYCGNLGRAHSAEFLISLAQQLDTKKFSFIVSTFGPKSEEVLNAIEGMEGVTVLPKIKIEEMKFIDIHSVSLLPEWTNVCVPSKAFTAIKAKGAVLFYGEERSDSWEIVQNSGWRIDPEKDLDYQISCFLSEFSMDDLRTKKMNTIFTSNSIEKNKLNALNLIAKNMFELNKKQLPASKELEQVYKNVRPQNHSEILDIVEKHFDTHLPAETPLRGRKANANGLKKILTSFFAMLFLTFFVIYGISDNAWFSGAVSTTASFVTMSLNSVFVKG